MEKHDIIVVGAGISGLSTAYHLKQQNRDLDMLIVDKAQSLTYLEKGLNIISYHW